MKSKQKNIFILLVAVVLIVGLFYFASVMQSPGGGEIEEQDELQELEADIEDIELEDFEEEFGDIEEDIEQL